MPRNYKLYIKDMLEAIESIQEYTDEIDYEDFEEDEMIVDAVLSNFQKMGEAAAEIPEEVRQKQDIEWQDVKDFRNVVVHQYWKVDKEIAWDIIQNQLPELEQNSENLRQK